MNAASPTVIARPQALALLTRGIETLAAPLVGTLGPGPGLVLNERTQREIELLTDAYTIARRVIQIPGCGSNLGAMLLRKMAVELHDHFGDGVATATVMTQAMLREATRRLAAGTNPVSMTRGIRLAVEAAQTALAAQARPLAGEDDLVALATSVTGDASLGALLGQMFEVMGESATIIMQEVPQPCLDHDYIRGGKWDGYLPARQLLPEGEVSLILHRPLIVLADEDLTTVEQVRPILELVLNEQDKSPLLIFARSFAGEALTMLSANHARGVLTIGLFVLSSGSTLLHDDLADLAALTGGEVLSPVTGTQTRDIQVRHLGRAKQANLSAQSVTLVDGAGAPALIQQRIAGVRAQLKRVSRGEESEWKFLRVRLARLTGGIGILKLGAHTEQELALKKEQIGKALRVLEGAYAEGLVPGGGAAFLACLPALERVYAVCRHEDERAGVSLVEAALQAPFLQIVRNHGELHPPLALDTVRWLGPGYGFDALRGDFARMDERQILDGLYITRGVLEAATSLVSMLITTDTLVFS